MTNLLEKNIKIAEQRLKEAEERRERFITKYMEKMKKDQELLEKNIKIAEQELKDAYIKLREEKK